MNLQITFTPALVVPAYVNGLTPYLEKSEMWTRGRAKVKDILEFLLSGQMHLWMVYDQDDSNVKPYGYVITEIKQYPQCKMLAIQYCAGERNHMSHVEDRMFQVLESFARDAGCAGIELFGRPGWTAHVKKYGYESQTIVYEKYFGGAK